MDKWGRRRHQKGGGETKREDESTRGAKPETARLSSGKNQSADFIAWIFIDRSEQIVQPYAVCCASILYLNLHLNFIHISEFSPFHVPEL